MEKPEFVKLIDKYLSGNASLEEEQLLLNFFNSFHSETDWDETQLGLKQQLEDKMLARLQRSLNAAASEHRKSLVSLSILKYTAAAILIITLTTVLLSRYNNKSNIKQQVTSILKPEKYDVEPGNNKATLTLSNGSKIELNSAKIGVLTSAGHIRVKKVKDGQLVYLISPSKNLDADIQVAFNTINTPLGGQYQVILPDGTKVWLNAASSLKYPLTFRGGRREVELKGEAYFEVTKNAAMPFYVKLNNMQVKVLGTHFNIMAYDNEPTVKTTLLEGSVELSCNSAANRLKPGQQGVLNKNGQILITDVNSEYAIAWKNGYFQFNRSNVQEIMNQLARWYDIEIAYKGNIPEDEFVGKIERSAKLSQVLNILRLSKIHFVLENKKLTVEN